jgi:hypothetical protein
MWQCRSPLMRGGNALRDVRGVGTEWVAPTYPGAECRFHRDGHRHCWSRRPVLSKVVDVSINSRPSTGDTTRCGAFESRTRRTVDQWLVAKRRLARGQCRHRQGPGGGGGGAGGPGQGRSGRHTTGPGPGPGGGGGPNGPALATAPPKPIAARVRPPHSATPPSSRRC